MTLTAAGMLLLPSALAFIGTLFLTAMLIRRCRLPLIAMVPFGVVSFIVAMWMLSGANGESGFPDLMPAILLRGIALGFLFLPITLITLLELRGTAIAYGVGLFNAGRQAGGLLGVAFLETLIDHERALNQSVLAAHILPGRTAVTERLVALTRGLAAYGMEQGEAAKVAVRLLGREVAMQAGIIAFDTAFLVVTLFFFAAAPVLIGAKVLIARLVSEPAA